MLRTLIVNYNCIMKSRLKTKLPFLYVHAQAIFNKPPYCTREYTTCNYENLKTLHNPYSHLFSNLVALTKIYSFLQPVYVYAMVNIQARRLSFWAGQDNSFRWKKITSRETLLASFSAI